MIRPFTCLTMVLAAGAGMFLYQTKHQAQLLDREITRTLKAADAARERSGVLRAEYALLSDPQRLADLAQHHLTLATTAPGQFTTVAELDRRLPAVALPAPPSATDAAADDEADASPRTRDPAAVPPPPPVAVATKPIAPPTRVAAVAKPVIRQVVAAAPVLSEADRLMEAELARGFGPPRPVAPIVIARRPVLPSAGPGWPRVADAAAFPASPPPGAPAGSSLGMARSMVSPAGYGTTGAIR